MNLTTKPKPGRKVGQPVNDGNSLWKVLSKVHHVRNIELEKRMSSNAVMLAKQDVQSFTNHTGISLLNYISMKG